MGRDEVTQLAAATWRTAKRMILESVDDPNSTLRTKVAENVMHFGGAAARRRRAARQGRRLAAGRCPLHRRELRGRDHRGDPGDRRAVGRDEASRKIELAVGRDLQFIRINGTVVGSLAGLAIYTVSQLLFA